MQRLNMAAVKRKLKPNKWLHRKRWSLQSFRERKFTDHPFIPSDVDCNSQYDELERFLDEGKSSRPSRRTEVIRKFCESSANDDAFKPDASAPDRAWINCRSMSTELDQGIIERLDPARLTEILLSQVCSLYTWWRYLTLLAIWFYVHNEFIPTSHVSWFYTKVSVELEFKASQAWCYSYHTLWNWAAIDLCH